MRLAAAPDSDLVSGRRLDSYPAGLGATLPGAAKRESEYRGGLQAATRPAARGQRACRGLAPALLSSPASRGGPQSPAAGRSEGQSGALL